MGIPLPQVCWVEQDLTPSVEVKHIGDVDPNRSFMRPGEGVFKQVWPVVLIQLERIVGVQEIEVKPPWHVIHCGT